MRQAAEAALEMREAMEELIERMQRNRLDDDQLRNLADQTRDLLDYAGRASGRAVEAIQERQAGGPVQPPPLRVARKQMRPGGCPGWRTTNENGSAELHGPGPGPQRRTGGA